MGFIVFIVVMACLANLIGDLTDFLAQYGLYIGAALAALAGYRYTRQKLEEKEEEQQKKLEEEDRRRMAAMADSGGKVNLSKQKPMGDDEEGDEDSYFSNIQHMAR